MKEEDLVEIELELDEETIEVLEERSKFLGITIEELIVRILEEELDNEVIKETSQGEVDTPTKISTG